MTEVEVKKAQDSLQSRLAQVIELLNRQQQGTPEGSISQFMIGKTGC